MPENDAYLDTLAVVLHRRGDLDGAVAAMRTCLRLKPHDHHYRWQLAKWLSEAGVKP
jgi:Flp pilus assembly protein TadD